MHSWYIHSVVCNTVTSNSCWQQCMFCMYHLARGMRNYETLRDILLLLSLSTFLGQLHSYQYNSVRQASLPQLPPCHTF